MSELSVAASVLQSMLPYFLLFLFPLRDRLRFSVRVNLPFVFLYLCGSTLVLIHFLDGKQTGEINLFAVSLTFMSAAGMVCAVFLRGRLMINVFYLFVIKNYWDIILLISRTSRPFYSLYPENCPIDAETFDKILLTAATFPLLYWFVAKLLKPIVRETEEHTFWKQLWYIPLLFFLCFYLLIVRHTDVLCDAFPLFPEVWILVTFLTYYLILYMMREAAHVRKLEELLSLAEFQAEIQRSQYRDLLSGIEAAKMQNHDMRHILLALKGYMQKEDLEGFRRYIHRYRKEHPAEVPKAEASDSKDGETAGISEPHKPPQ